MFYMENKTIKNSPQSAERYNKLVTYKKYLIKGTNHFNQMRSKYTRFFSWHLRVLKFLRLDKPASYIKGKLSAPITQLLLCTEWPKQLHHFQLSDTLKSLTYTHIPGSMKMIFDFLD